jgi:hypothetical protein
MFGIIARMPWWLGLRIHAAAPSAPSASNTEWKKQPPCKPAHATYRIIGYFPPTKDDPVLRLTFPRRVEPSDKTVVFRLYLPGLSFPEREVLFKVKELLWRGRLEM